MEDGDRDGAMLRPFVLGFTGAVVGVALMLFAYDRFVAQPREAAGAAIRELRDARGPRVTPEPAADSPPPDAERPPDDSLATAVAEGAGRAGSALANLVGGGKTELAREALAHAGMYKVAISEVYVSNGRWPANAEEAGLPPFDATTGGAVGAIAVREQGVIVLELREPFAQGSRLVLTPSAGSDYSIRWTCRGEGDPAAVSACAP